MSKKLFGDMHTKPSYGQVEFSRISCTPPISLYGSSAKHSHIIAMRVMKSASSRDLSERRYFSHETIVEAYLSPNQFSELITRLNMVVVYPVL